ncbi:hypothetical protein C1645_762412 [Glomus cerebriforme]|uniref:Uncharacterized protein n=1 Tax=Glomus cerebriforme TaxID=658196 RepID=A0A397TF36_9GLOM|nr:hypothetical protein C1645_762412 [Glomus cerebriforme]
MATWNPEDPFSWLKNLREKWQKNLNLEFVEPFRTNQIITPFGQEGKTLFLHAQLPADTDYHYMGRLGGSMGLHFSTIKENGFRNANRLFGGKSGTLGGKFDNNSTESEIAPINRECNVLEGYFETKRKSCEIHDGRVNSLPNKYKESGIRIKDKEHADINVGIGYGGCSNPRSIGILQSSFGKLCRVGSLAGYEWTTEVPSKTCRFVHAYPYPTQEASGSNRDQGNMSQMSVREGQNDPTSSCNNTLILVDTFESKSDRRNIATSIGCEDLIDSDPKDLTFYIANVAEYCFDHIIFIGEVNYGMIFLDCYGRVFLWEDMSQMLYPLRDSLEEAPKYSKGQDRLAWIVENGKVYEYFMKPQRKYTDTKGGKALKK